MERSRSTLGGAPPETKGGIAEYFSIPANAGDIRQTAITTTGIKHFRIRVFILTCLFTV
jgi:hypothetical protein